MPTVEAARPVSRPDVLWAALLCAAVFTVGFAVANAAVDPDWARRVGTGPLDALAGEHSPLAVARGVLARNLPALALLYSGVLTLGLSTLLGLGVVSAYVGATFKVGSTTSGLVALLGQTAVYGVPEMLAMVTAAAAGLYPVVRTARSLWSRGGADAAHQAAWVTYARAVPGSLLILLAATAILVVAAVLEAWVVTAR